MIGVLYKKETGKNFTLFSGEIDVREKQEQFNWLLEKATPKIKADLSRYFENSEKVKEKENI